jgi:RAB6A-GEF complex partner protein 2
MVIFIKNLLTIEHGRQPNYDLKSPIILLRDEAKALLLKEGEVLPPLPTTKPKQIRRSSTYSDKPIESSREEFMDFVDHLLGSLGKAPSSASDPLLRLNVPSSPFPSPTKERTFRPLSCREVIDVIIQRGLDNISGMKAKVGVFEIGKNGITVATLTLPKTIFKLGETIDGVLDLDDENIKCYQVCILEDGVTDECRLDQC